MKKLTLILLLLSSLVCIGQYFFGLQQATLAPLVVAAGGGGCTTLGANWYDTSGGSLSTEASKYYGTSFSNITTRTICKVTLSLQKHGSPTGTIRVGIFSHDAANEPDTLIDWSDTIDISTLPASEGDFTFDSGLSAAVTANTMYWVVIEDSDGGDWDGAGAYWHWHDAGITNDLVSSPDASTWSSQSPYDTFKYKTYSE